MEYILFAVLAMVASGCNAIANKFASGKISTAVSSVVKSFFMIIACFVIVCCFGHLDSLYELTSKQWLYIILIGLFTSADWIFYFAAMKRSHIETFIPFYETAQLLFSDLFFLIFTFSLVTNANNVVSVILYCVGLGFLLSAMVIVGFSKKLNPQVNRKWIIFALLAAIAYASTLLVMKTQIVDIPSDIISFHQIVIVFIVSLVVMLVKREWLFFKSISWKGYLIFFIAALFNTGLMIFRYIALSYSNSNPAIINSIIGLQFVLVAVVSVFFKKSDDKLITLIVISLLTIGVVLNMISGVI